MKFTQIAKTLPIVLGLGICATANAGVQATSYLEINELFVEIDEDRDGVADVADVTDFIEVLFAERSGATSTNFNNVTDGDTAFDASGVGIADAGLVCSGPSCAGLALVDNGQSLDAGNLVYSDAFNFAASDMRVSGDALGAGATGFTYGDIGINTANAEAATASSIFNTLLTELTLDVTSDINLRFTGLYDLLVDAIISADIAGSSAMTSAAKASASFSVELVAAGGGASVNDGGDAEDGFQFSDQALDLPGAGNLFVFSANDVGFATDWFKLTAGIYQVSIVQESITTARMISAPGAIALFGMGLMGLGLSARRKSRK